MDYWQECIAEAAESCGANLTSGQIEEIASWVEGAHDNFSQAHGHDVFSRNRSAELQRKLDEERAEVLRERAKITCAACGGRGRTIIRGPCHLGESECGECRGVGRVDP